MTETDFWAIIDRSSVFEADPDRQLEALSEALRALSAEEILAFQAQFDRQLTRAYNWDVWAVAYIAHGGASDDGFEYFRRWLVSKGRGVFERIVAHPDDLGLLLAPGHGVAEFEEFFYVAGEVWAQKSGLPAFEIPESLEFKTDGTEPKGEPFSDDPVDLARRFPKTWAAFGDAPLQ